MEIPLLMEAKLAERLLLDELWVKPNVEPVKREMKKRNYISTEKEAQQLFPIALLISACFSNVHNHQDDTDLHIL